MAYKDSGALSIGQSYQLGAYTFSITATPDPGEGTTGINVRCDKGGERARVASEVTGTVESWRVEANDDTVDVYASVKAPLGPSTEPFYLPVPASSGRAVGYYDVGSNRVLVGLGSNPKGTATWTRNLNDGWFTLLLAQSDNPTPFADFLVADAHYSYVNHGSSYTFAGQTVYFCLSLNNNYSGVAPPVGYDLDQSAFGNAAGPIAWQMIYGADAGKTKDVLAARFAIDLHDAGGTGTGSDWHDPGDWDDERDPEDPPTTLRLTITGATAGTHSGVPSAPAPQQNYGSGGNGGNGGGGGAGASTIIFYKFATDRADNKGITATARGPGAGSSGGPGGKGGDGCILIFY